ncbi:MAG: TetR family transcriptional regulator [Terrimesophilobacter sp.]
MRTTRTDVASELTTRARLRNSAVEIFAVHGFDASVRDIAAHAGVTAGLITHHFGSKQKLREECDAEVLRQYTSSKREGMAMSPTQSIASMAANDEFAPMLLYVLRSVREGGPAGVSLLENMIDETVRFTEEGVASGIVRPSRDPLARARYMVTTSLGGLLLQLSLVPELNLAEIGPTLRRIIDEITLPTLELYTEGVLMEKRYLDEYLLYIGDPPGGTDTTTSTS